MRKVILYIAMSLDGFIASKDGKVDWLHGQNVDEENIDTYSSFIKDVDTVIMGWNTYYQIKMNYHQIIGYMILWQVI